MSDITGPEGDRGPDTPDRFMPYDSGGGERIYVAGNYVDVSDTPYIDHEPIVSFTGSSSPFSFANPAFDDFGMAIPALLDLSVFKGSLYTVGLFSGPQGLESSNIARWNGTTWSAVTHGADHIVEGSTVADVGDGEALYIGGAFGNVDRHFFTDSGTAIPAVHVARWSGSSWRKLGPGVGPFDGQPSDTGKHVHVLRGWDAGDGNGTLLYVGGRFTEAGNIPANDIARWGCGVPRDRDDLGPLTWAPLGDIGPAISFQFGGDGIPLVAECGDETTPIVPGDDLVVCEYRVVVGTPGDDVIDLGRSTTGAVVFSGTGNDSIVGSPLRDVLFGNAGDDTIDGGSGDDRILGGSGVDAIQGGTGDDALSGGEGDDSLEGGDHFDYFDAQSGIDQVLDEGEGDVVQL